VNKLETILASELYQFKKINKDALARRHILFVVLE